MVLRCLHGSLSNRLRTQVVDLPRDETCPQAATNAWDVIGCIARAGIFVAVSVADVSAAALDTLEATTMVGRPCVKQRSMDPGLERAFF